MTFTENALFPFRLLKEHDYALVDRYLIGDSVHDIATIAPDLLPVVPTGMEADADKFPTLLHLSELSDDALQALFALLERAHSAHEMLPIVCLFKCDDSIEQLRWHWMRKIVVQAAPPQKLAAPGQKFQLRSYVPSVLVQLQRIYTPAQFKALFGNIQVWSIYHGQRWHSINAPPECASDHCLFEEAQLAQLLRIQAINRTLTELSARQDSAQTEDEMTSGLPRPHYRPENPADFFTMSHAIDNLIVRAQTHGLMREDDQVQFALHGLTQHLQFDAHPRIQKMLAEMDGQEQTYLDATALLQPDDWQRIQTDLQSAAPNKA